MVLSAKAYGKLSTAYYKMLRKIAAGRACQKLSIASKGDLLILSTHVVVVSKGNLLVLGTKV